ncbi:MAG TPA: ELM1/GtrOC1 family putative glycosyltransferase [Candidatus Omnitrophota bacterium]|nr:ELM1/GtrOC1 family putative glycosyltransferase [Candidatus Omnitrophota bacterium]
MHYLKEFIIYYSVRLFGLFLRCLPVSAALAIGRLIGLMAYLFDAKRRGQVYANLKIAFADSKSPEEIKNITKGCFKSYGQNLIELFRIPSIGNLKKFKDVVDIQGQEHIEEALKLGRGVILLAMHFGSWEIASFSCGMLGRPYKVIVKQQKKHSRLDELLNSYRTCGGQVVLSRGMGTRDFLKSLKNNEIIGMVVDQGGRDGILVPFFGRKASMSSGAMRIGLKYGVPICFSIIIRQKGYKHRMVFHKPFELSKTDDMEKDAEANLKAVALRMEDYIRQYPAEYMWFYKIWKYSNEANVAILADNITGHLRQSQAVARTAQVALSERRIHSNEMTINVRFKSLFYQKLFSMISVLIYPFIRQGKIGFLRWFLTPQSLKEVNSLRADFMISCGSSLAGLNKILSKEHNAKSICILKPGLFRYAAFDMVVLPQHDAPQKYRDIFSHEDQLPFCITHAAANLITDEYLEEQKERLLKHFTHLQGKVRTKIGVFIGGDAKNVYLSEVQIKMLVHQLKEACAEINAEILCTSSRRTPPSIEQLLYRELKKDARCPLLVIANQENVPEAVGGILGLSDINVVSGDSISMISEAASSGKNTIVFYPEAKAKALSSSDKHHKFIKNLDQKGYIVTSDIKEIASAVFDVAKNKIQTKRLDDYAVVLEAMRYVI